MIEDLCDVAIGSSDNDMSIVVVVAVESPDLGNVREVGERPSDKDTFCGLEVDLAQIAVIGGDNGMSVVVIRCIEASNANYTTEIGKWRANIDAIGMEVNL